MAMVVETLLICDACGKQVEGQIIFGSPTDWVIDAPDEWIVRKPPGRGEQMSVCCCIDCDREKNPVASA